MAVMVAREAMRKCRNVKPNRRRLRSRKPPDPAADRGHAPGILPDGTRPWLLSCAAILSPSDRRAFLIWRIPSVHERGELPWPRQSALISAQRIPSLLLWKATGRR